MSRSEEEIQQSFERIKTLFHNQTQNIANNLQTKILEVVENEIINQNQPEEKIKNTILKLKTDLQDYIKQE